MKRNCILFLLFTLIYLGNSETTPCNLRETEFGYVCVCTANYCDYLEDPRQIEEKEFTVVSSSKNGLRFATSKGKFDENETIYVKDFDSENILEKKFDRLSKANNAIFDQIVILIDERRTYIWNKYVGKPNGTYVALPNIPKRRGPVYIDREKQLQKVVGFGGAFTGTVSHIIKQLDTNLQNHIYKSYFHKDGIQFNMLRMSIGGSDFDLAPWAYNESPSNDPKLSNFTKLDPRDEQKIVQMRKLKEVSGIESIKIVAAAWSPPIWMKTNLDWTGYSSLKQEYYQAWADYHLKFLELMDAKNMTIWAISTGNEPLNGIIGWFFVRFMSLGWTPKNQAIWLSENLGPTIRNSKYKNVLIFGNDDQRYTFPSWFRTMNATRPNSLDYLDGLAVHWYWDKIFGPGLIDKAHKDMPKKLLLNTESCMGDKPWQRHQPDLGSWERAEQYITSFMEDFKHDFNGWIDWNIVLDEKGGPNYVKNYVDAPVIVNTTNLSEFYKQPMFYAIGHFSKFVPEGSVRIKVDVFDAFNLYAIAFLRPDGKIAAILYNSELVPIDVAITDSLRGNIVINIPAKSIHSFVYN